MNKNIVMIHGMAGGGWCWDDYKHFFEQKGYRCHTPTLRFHQDSIYSTPNPQLGTTSILDYVADLETEIQQLDSLPIIIGHSMGGLIAQILGSRSLAQALVLITPAPPHGILIKSKLLVIKGFLGVFTKWGFWKKPFRPSFNGFVNSVAHLLPASQQKAIYDRLSWESGRVKIEIGFSMFYQNPPTEVDDSKITGPMLVIGSTQDRITPISLVNKVAKKYSAVSTYKVFPNHAHWIIGEEGWREVAEYIADWLKNHNG